MKKRSPNIGILGRIALADLNNAPHLVIRRQRRHPINVLSLLFALALPLLALSYFLWRMT